jgi:hypothetical protein
MNALQALHQIKTLGGKWRLHRRHDTDVFPRQYEPEDILSVELRPPIGALTTDRAIYTYDSGDWFTANGTDEQPSTEFVLHVTTGSGNKFIDTVTRIDT